MPITITITDEQRLNLLTSALEGGSNYWYYLGKDALNIIAEVCPPDKTTTLVDRMWQAIKAGKEIPVRAIENPRDVLGKLSLASIDKGEQLLADKHSHHLSDIVTENDDATTGDVWFQLSLMGEVVYG